MCAKRRNEQTIKEAIDQLLKAYGLEEKLKEFKLTGSWENVVGENIAKFTSDLYIKKRILFVKSRSAALRQELLFRRHELIDKLNAEAGGNVIDDIIVK